MTLASCSFTTIDPLANLFPVPVLPPSSGEHIRLVLEEAGVTYTDTAQTPGGGQTVVTSLSTSNPGDDLNPPPLAPPILRHGPLCLSQTPNILLYLGPRLNLVPSPTEDPYGLYHVNALTLTALDGLCSEAHDTHHPVGTGLRYEDQIPEAKRAASTYRAQRLPKFLAHFEQVLSGPASKGGEYLYGGKLTYADLVFFQALNGVTHAFPKRVDELKKSGKYKKAFNLYDRVQGRERIKAYLDSDRRQRYGMGIWRYYPELDGDDLEA